MSTNTRVSVTLPAVTANDLDVVSRVLGVTRSALIAEILAMSSAELRAAILKSAYRPSVEEGPALRLRGASTEVIQARLSHLWGVLNED